MARQRLARTLTTSGALALGVLLAPSVAHAYCRTTSKVLPANYQITDGCFTEGLPLFWRGACVGYDLNRAAASYVPLDVAQRIVDQAFATWSSVKCQATGENVGITAQNLGPVDCAEPLYDRYGPNQNVIVFREDDWPYTDATNTLGLTTVSFNFDTGELYDADMEINATGHDLSTSDEVSARGYDLLSVVTHEAGHFLGLAHTPVTDATMYPSYRPGTTSLRTLSPDDEAGICAVYPNPTERSVDPSVSPGGIMAATACDPTPRHGFTTTCVPSAPPKQESGCAVMGEVRAGSSRGLAFAAAFVGLMVVRRRRSRANIAG